MGLKRAMARRLHLVLNPTLARKTIMGLIGVMARTRILGLSSVLARMPLLVLRFDVARTSVLGLTCCGSLPIRFPVNVSCVAQLLEGVGRAYR